MLLPLSTIGILGGGQLGRMLAMAAAHMGYRTHVYCPEAHCPAAQVANEITNAAYDDAAALQAFAKACDVITFEFENVPPEPLAMLERITQVHPSVNVLRTCRHRLREKQTIQSFGIPVAPFASVETKAELKAAIETIGYPCVLKRCKEGYDGKGQMKITDAETAEQAWLKLGEQPCVLEAWLGFSCEISVIVARDKAGQARCYEPSLNQHEHHILARSSVPANVASATAAQAQQIALTLAEKLNLTGLLAVEFFAMPDGSLIVNELAPRPHNSGHWTIEAAATSQFEQQIRAICGMALGDTRTLSAVEMINLIGEEVDGLAQYQHNPHAHIHVYGKTETRPGRKMGHVTILR
ncbi:MAG: 5-(carboxyamino)imidazole ribonucleotide synthase [Rickettsiales bacterium]|nr:5-(carboxyamino)imidazole ribonucleotide synthase [Rickettsiales bacterium]